MMSPEELYKKMLELYEPIPKSIGLEKWQEYSKSNLFLNEFSKNENSLKMIFDNVNYKVLSISDNLEEMTGYTKADFDKANVLLYFQSLQLDHILAPIVLSKWGMDNFKYLATLKDIDYKQVLITFCGFKMKRKNGEKARALIRYYPLEMAENGQPTLYLITGDNITHLLKSDIYWGRISYGELPTQKAYYSSADKKRYHHDIISDREKDVLRLIADGYDSKEIAEKLFISINTVDNHRRNAIARTGVRDTTALLQICTMCGIL